MYILIFVLYLLFFLCNNCMCYDSILYYRYNEDYIKFYRKERDMIYCSEDYDIWQDIFEMWKMNLNLNILKCGK